MSSSISVKLKKLRTESGMSVSQICQMAAEANVTGFSHATVSRWEAGTSTPPIRAILFFARLYHVSTDYLLKEDTDTVTDNTNIKQIPFYGNVSAGLGDYTENRIEYEIGIPIQWLNPLCQYIVLMVDGDSMTPVFNNGDYLLIQVVNSVDSGTYGVVLVDGEEGLVKRIIYDATSVTLISVNPQYPPRTFRSEDLERLRVVGKVVKVFKDV